MLKYQSISFYGIMIILAGCSLLINSSSNVEVHAQIVSLVILISAVVASIAALRTKLNKVQSRYHLLHAAGLFFYGIAILFFHKSIADFSDLTALFFIYYGLSEIIFCFWLFNLKAQISVSQLVVRLSLGLLFFLSSTIMMGLRHPYQSIELISAGIIFIIIGIEVVLTIPIVTKMKSI